VSGAISTPPVAFASLSSYGVIFANLLPVAFHCGRIIALYGQSEGQKQLVLAQNKFLGIRQKPLSIGS
jgi:hypothetical protein